MAFFKKNFKKNKFKKRGDIIKDVKNSGELTGKDLIEYGNRLFEKGYKSYQSEIIINKFKESHNVDGLHKDSPNFKCAEIILDTMKEISQKEDSMFTGLLAKVEAERDAGKRSNPQHLLDMFNVSMKSKISIFLKSNEQSILSGGWKSAKRLYADMIDVFEQNMQRNFEMHTL